MGSLSQQEMSKPHFVLFPFMAQGHMIPMVDIAKLLARRGAIATLVTTPLNAARFESPVARARDSGLDIRVVELYFPAVEAGLPQGCENYDMLPNLHELFCNFFDACAMLEGQVEVLFRERLSPRPSCIISDIFFPYTLNIANKFNIPRITFHGFCSFALLCDRCVHMNCELLEAIPDGQYFVLPGLPDAMEFTKEQVLLTRVGKQHWERLDKMIHADLASYGVVINSFRELEPAFVEPYKKARGGGEVWCIGPVSLCNDNNLDKAERGNKASANDLIKWLDCRETESVVYTCLGSLCNLKPEQLMELGLGLEASERPFIWALRGNDSLKQVDEWIAETGFEERVKGRGMVIRGWVPQVLILSHPAVGGFITHCGWNSTLEGITAGVPLMTWPLFGDQFCNEKLVVQVLKVGVSVGVDRSTWQEEEIGILARKEDVRKGINSLMEEGEEGLARRERARELSRLARKAAGEGGSSDLTLTNLIQDIMQLADEEKEKKSLKCLKWLERKIIERSLIPSNDECLGLIKKGCTFCTT